MTTILIIDDSSTQAEYLRQHLQQDQVSVRWAYNGELGLQLAMLHQPQAIILDLEMPGLNGLEVCQRLKQNPLTYNIPIIIFSGRATPLNAEQIINLGIVDFIPKDAFSIPVLLELLRQLHILPDNGAKNA